DVLHELRELQILVAVIEADLVHDIAVVLGDRRRHHAFELALEILGELVRGLSLHLHRTHESKAPDPCDLALYTIGERLGIRSRLRRLCGREAGRGQGSESERSNGTAAGDWHLVLLGSTESEYSRASARGADESVTAACVRIGCAAAAAAA